MSAPGPPFVQSLFVDAVLAARPEMGFNAGTHLDTIAMQWNVCVKMDTPIVGRLAA
jgi:hypothetical protein